MSYTPKNIALHMCRYGNGISDPVFRTAGSKNLAELFRKIEPEIRQAAKTIRQFSGNPMGFTFTSTDTAQGHAPLLIAKIGPLRFDFDSFNGDYAIVLACYRKQEFLGVLGDIPSLATFIVNVYKAKINDTIWHIRPDDERNIALINSMIVMPNPAQAEIAKLREQLLELRSKIDIAVCEDLYELYEIKKELNFVELRCLSRAELRDHDNQLRKIDSRIAMAHHAHKIQHAEGQITSLKCYKYNIGCAVWFG